MKAILFKNAADGFKGIVWPDSSGLAGHDLGDRCGILHICVTFYVTKLLGHAGSAG